MEEKERYIIGKGEDIFIADNDRKVMFTITTKKLQDLLNQQDKELSKLRASYQQVKEENQQLKQQLAESEKEIASIQVLLSENAIDRKAMQEFKIGKDEYDLTDEDARNSLCWEVEELNQQLHDLPKKIVCEISEAIERLSWRKRIYTNWEFDKEQLYKDLDTILKKYGGENE